MASGVHAAVAGVGGLHRAGAARPCAVGGSAMGGVQVVDGHAAAFAAVAGVVVHVGAGLEIEQLVVPGAAEGLW